MQAYRCAWMRITVVVLACGAVVLLGAWALVSPRSLVVAFACWWLARRLARPTTTIGALSRRWLRLAGTPPEHDAAAARGVGMLVAFLFSAVGWHLLLGGAGTALVLVDAVLGLPLLLPSGASLQAELESLREIQSNEKVDVPEPRSAHVVRAEPDRRSTEPLALSEPTPPTGPTGVAAWCGPRTLLPGLSDTELWHAWRASARALRVETNPAARLRIVAARSQYLDALAERDPQGFARQLSMDGPSGWASFEPPT